MVLLEVTLKGLLIDKKLSVLLFFDSKGTSGCLTLGLEESLIVEGGSNIT